MSRPRKITILVVILGIASLSSPTRARFQEELVYHTIRTDHEGKIIPWHSHDLGKSYDHVIRLVWDFWKNMRECPNGVKYYMQHRIWKKHDDHRGLGGDQLNMALSSWNFLHQYLGDPAVKENMVYIADHYLANSLSNPAHLWPNVPYPFNLELHSGVYDGDLQAGKDFFQPDKAATFAAELVILYKITGARGYLDAAIKIADTLADRIEPGDADHSPWPYRVNTRNGKVHKVKKNGTVHRATYTANWAGALRMFDYLIELNEGRVAEYRRARSMLADWIKSYPLKNNRWGPFFEDIRTENYSDTETNADTMATYILENPVWDPEWKQHVESILNWSFTTFANRNWIKYGVVAINEQTQFMVPGNSHTSRHASVELMLGENTGDHSRKADAIRRLNWATYMVNVDGRNQYPMTNIWLTDGYGDYVRHYLRSMAAAPELAPESQNHLLRTSSVVQSISYGPDVITYTKFDEQSRERFKLGEWQPGSIEGGEMSWSANTRVLEVRAHNRTVTIRRGQ